MKLIAVVPVLLAALPLAVGYSNPVLYEDLADVDLRRVNNTYYYSASTMHFSPGAPILRSYDLANWEYIGHSVPQLADFGSKYTLTNGERAYIRGVWASWLIYVPDNSKWYWGGCTDFWNTHVYESSTADPATSTWSRIFTKQQGCHYDAGALLDTDGYVYVSFKDGGVFYIAQFAKDMKSILKTQQVYTPPSDRSDMEGTRPYKINGTYYIFSSHPSGGAEYALKASGDIWSTYEDKVFLSGAVPQPPLTGSIGQGALVDTPDGKWYWMGFSWSYPNGRIPCLIPVTWGSDGFPVPTLVNGQVAATYPNVATPHTVPPTTGSDFFTGPKLSHLWEWNHDPDTTKFSVSSGLKLSTATVTDDLYAARNTITRRQLGPISTATIILTVSSMANGDRAGFAMFRESSAYIGVHKTDDAYALVYVNNLLLEDSDNGWQTTSTGTIVQSTTLSSSLVWLRIISDSTPAGNTVKFYYSTDGTNFSAFGPTFQATTSWQFFEGARYAIFNFATSALGGSITVHNFELAPISYTGPALTITALPTTSGTSTVTYTIPEDPCSVPKFGQCGGEGYTGCTKCATGTTCNVFNQWYSQCL